VVVAIALASFSSGYFLGSTNSGNSRPWLFRGAYAVYFVTENGTSITGGSVSYNLTEKVMILDFNSTEVQERSNTNSTIAGVTNSTTTEWVPLNLLGDFETTAPPGLNLTGISHVSLRIEGRQIECTLYRFSNPAENETASSYFSDSAKFQVESAFTLSTNGETINFTQVLVSSNIPGLS